MTPAEAPQSVPVRKIDRKHKEWVLYNSMWERLDLLHEGGTRLQNAVFSGDGQLLIKRPKELIDVYQQRCQRLTYKNILGNCIGWYVAKLFQRNPVIDAKNTDAFYGAFLEDSDNAGTAFIDFFRGVLLSMLLYRTAYVLVDKPRADEPPASRADEQERGLDKPYLCGYLPIQVINWSQDDYGNLNWIVIKTVEEKQDAFDGDLQSIHTWYVFDKQSFREYRVTGDLREEQDGSYRLYGPDGNPLGNPDVRAELVAGPSPHVLASQNRVPVRRLELPPVLWLSNRAYLELLDHMNTENAYSWALFMANLAMPLVTGQPDIKTITLTEAGFLHFPDPQAKFSWTEPEGKSFQHSQQRLDTLRQEVYRSFYLTAQGQDSSASANSASGYSKEISMMPANDISNGLGDVLRAGMQNVLIDVRDAHGDSSEDPDVQGFRFETRPAMQDITVAQSVIDLGLTDKSPTLEKELDKRVALSILDDANDSTKEAVTKEIENAPTRPEVRDQAQQDQLKAFETRFQRATATNVLKQEELSVA